MTQKQGGRAQHHTHVLHAPVPLVEHNTLPSDIRYFYPNFVMNGAANSLNDPRILHRTFRGALIHDIVRYVCLDITNFFQKTRAQKLVWINQLFFGNEYSEAHTHQMLDMTVELPIQFHRVLLFPYHDEITNLHLLQLSFTFPYMYHGQRKWMVVHHDFHDITVTFNIEDLDDAEEIVYSTGMDPLLSAQDNAIMFFDVDQIAFDPMHGGQLHKYKNRWYKVQKGARGGSYIRSLGKKVYI